ncbi:sensor histidine kinase [Saccharomonospora piscinae]|uniref:sensor histidine kinase n=1 Tax=Saccharomonospora piscinae TaxID=687388 RepID=UPI001ABEAA23|nr:histidine kinase [Saccharomonospora piscinae]
MPSSRVHTVLGVLTTVLAVGASLLSSLFVFGAATAVPGGDDVDITWRPALGFLGALGAAVALCWRHTHPLVVTGVAALPPLLFVTDALAALIALAALTAHRRDRAAWAAVAVVFAATAVAVVYDGHRHADMSVIRIVFGPAGLPVPVLLLVAALLTAVPAALGAHRATRRDLARNTAVQRGLQADLARKDERSRIAREMHDVLGHRLSLLSLHAGALEVTAPQESGQAAEVARTVRSTAQASLHDLRQVIGVLRDGRDFTGDGTRPERSGPPTLADLPALVGTTREAGVSLNVTILVDNAGDAPPRLAETAYRVVQESLTNVLRHAPSETADVTVRGGPGAGITVEIDNPLPAAPPAGPPAGSGSGLAGLADRVSSVEGTISTGPTERGRFVVHAWLPWPREGQPTS